MEVESDWRRLKVAAGPAASLVLVHPLAAEGGAAQAGDLVLVILKVKLVVVGQLKQSTQHSYTTGQLLVLRLHSRHHTHTHIWKGGRGEDI